MQTRRQPGVVVGSLGQHRASLVSSAARSLRPKITGPPQLIGALAGVFSSRSPAPRRVAGNAVTAGKTTGAPFEYLQRFAKSIGAANAELPGPDIPLQAAQYAPEPRTTADSVFHKICTSSMSDQFST
jgi:hypothetical protein